jgi:FkbM family methyltransferase
MIKHLIFRFFTLLRRKKRAKCLGFKFRRAADFVLPSVLKLKTREIKLNIPIDNGSKTAFIDILLDDCYNLTFFPDNIKTVVDIGAHVGIFSISARQRWSSAVIHAYEPNPGVHPNLLYHSHQVGNPVYLEAVGLKAGIISLTANNESVQMRSIVDPAGKMTQVAFCDVVARLGGQVDLVKLDCEGAEWDILSDDVSWANVRFLTMEFHLWAGYTLVDLRQRILDLGFHIEHCELTGPDFGLLSASKLIYR